MSEETDPVEGLKNFNPTDEKFQINEMLPLPNLTPNRKEIKEIFNRGMEDFLQNNKNIHGCPYDEKDDQRVTAWREGFQYAVHEFSKQFSQFCVQEMLMKNQEKDQIVKPTLDVNDVVEIVER